MTGRRWCWRCGRVCESGDGGCAFCNSASAAFAKTARALLHPFDLWWVWAFSRERGLRMQALPAALDMHRRHSHLMTLHREPGAFASQRSSQLEEREQRTTADTREGFSGGRREWLNEQAGLSYYDIASAYPFEQCESATMSKVVGLFFGGRREGDR